MAALKHQVEEVVSALHNNALKQVEHQVEHGVAALQRVEHQVEHVVAAPTSGKSGKNISRRPISVTLGM